MWRLLLIVVWILSSSILLENKVRPVFGVRVSIGTNSTINTYACFIDNGRVITQKRFFDEQSFIKIVSGHWPSIYNPKRINYFEVNNIGCGVVKDSITLKDIPYCEPFKTLWKIRFAKYPFRGNGDIGWSKKLHKPSLNQEKYLYDRYGVRSVDANFFVDTSFWMLLKDVQDSSWIRNYENLN